MKRIGTAPTPGPRTGSAPDWTLAACRQVDPDLHYPLSDNPRHQQQLADARRVCARCPLTGPDGPCLQQALADEHHAPIDRRHGVRAGTTPQQRLDMDKETA